jgi:phenylpropionate dioxygenase-like ring-hydroxylating dioxygenase large terminal subunit
MGEFVRQPWVPALLSSEPTAADDPVRLTLLGGHLVAFGDNDGRVGVIYHRCPTATPPRLRGRDEGGGITCAYHGCRFGVDGASLEQGNPAPGDQCCDTVRAQAYPTVEPNRPVRTYPGSRTMPPTLRGIGVTLMPASALVIRPVMRSCNWPQPREGDIDTSHDGFHHAGHIRPEDLAPDNPMRGTVTNRAPRYHVRDIPSVTYSGAYRPPGQGWTYRRFANSLVPFGTLGSRSGFLVGPEGSDRLDAYAENLARAERPACRPSGGEGDRNRASASEPGADGGGARRAPSRAQPRGTP